MLADLAGLSALPQPVPIRQLRVRAGTCPGKATGPGGSEDSAATPLLAHPRWGSRLREEPTHGRTCGLCVLSSPHPLPPANRGPMEDPGSLTGLETRLRCARPCVTAGPGCSLSCPPVGEQGPLEGAVGTSQASHLSSRAGTAQAPVTLMGRKCFGDSPLCRHSLPTWTNRPAQQVDRSTRQWSQAATSRWGSRADGTGGTAWGASS